MTEQSGKPVLDNNLGLTIILSKACELILFVNPSSAAAVTQL